MTNKTSGGKVEIFLERVIDTARALVRLGGNTKNLIGKKLVIDRAIEVVVLSKKDDLFIIEAKTGSILETFLQFGQV